VVFGDEFWRCISHCWFRRCHPTHLFDKSVFCMGPFVLAPITESLCRIFRHRISQLDLLSPPKSEDQGSKRSAGAFRVVCPWQVLAILSNGIGKKCSVENAQLSKMVSHHRLSLTWCYKKLHPKNSSCNFRSLQKPYGLILQGWHLAGAQVSKIQGDFMIDVITIETLQENKENYTRFMLNNGDSVPSIPGMTWKDVSHPRNLWILTTLR